jgi:hypothetical protein
LDSTCKQCEAISPKNIELIVVALTINDDVSVLFFTR